MKEKIKSRVKELKKELVLEEATSYFEEVGFEALKMQDLAKKCKISVGALYQLFGSKENLFYEYILRQINIFYQNLLKKCENAKSPEEKLKIFIKLKFETFSKKPKIIQDPIAGDPLFFYKLNRKKGNPAQIILEFLAREFENLNKKNALKSKNFLETAYVFNSFTFGYIEFWLDYDGNLEEKTEEAYRIFIEGILKKS
ncbi:TetR/AcrR family transcriptional regulator [Nitrosophilus alvini]|uniref:TetR/AcrR family transcriptional regulator n=1 Tax=Nitrosophilus alvini TaxID=2714855 RepID=UPI00190AFC9F|nr:TetR/AcrR family transcriptional regulator [Nitrosophilus alvini]